MTDQEGKPLLFLDVDGPLIPFGRVPVSASGPSFAPERHAEENPLAARIDPALGPLLSALPCELIWATTWTDEANRSISPVLGLPTLAVLDWPDAQEDHIDEWFGLHWKTRALVERAAGRPFIWIDDEIGDGDREWVTEQHPGRALLHRVDPRVGLRPHDLDTVTEWLTSTGIR
ncbi:HAD domain-containing protein [Nocardia fusca]|uniref:HAD domain-containing protein n=1 Tax=Nocardia fusca TaxID=941183 RepID=UPI0007A76856|nr:HAD domain-containing protein [Nocardia fusca]